MILWRSNKRRHFLRRLCDVLLSVGTGLTYHEAIAESIRSEELHSVRDFGATGDGRSNDRAAIREALQASSRVHFPAGKYLLGEISDGEVVFDLRTRSDMQLTTAGEVLLIVSTSKKVFPAIFAFSGGANATIGNFTIVDTAGDQNAKWQGAIGFLFVPGTEKAPTASIGRIRGQNLTSLLTVRGFNGNRVSGINVASIVAQDCYYGATFQENGDNVTIGQLSTLRCFRSYFVYGVKEHNVNIVSRNGRKASADVLIKRYRIDTERIKLVYRAEGSRIEAPNGLVVLEHQPDSKSAPSIISDIDIDVSVASSAATGMPVLFRSYTEAGVMELETQNRWHGIRVKFAAIETATQISIASSSTPRVQDIITVNGLTSKNISRSISNAFKVEQDSANQN